jgi:hypothetical protein
MSQFTTKKKPSTKKSLTKEPTKKRKDTGNPSSGRPKKRSKRGKCRSKRGKALPTLEETFCSGQYLFKDSKDPAAAEFLEKYGFVVVPIFKDAKELEELKGEIHDDIRNFPIWKRKIDNIAQLGRVSLGGSGIQSFCNAGSFHCTSVRKVRDYEHKVLLPLLQGIGSRLLQKHDLDPDHPLWYAQLIDRLSIRDPKFKIPGKGTWHRDFGGTFVLGGSVNLTPGRPQYPDGYQYFWIEPCTHEFSLFCKQYGFKKLDKEEQDRLYDEGVYVAVPPGYRFLFCSDLKHAICPLYDEGNEEDGGKSLRLFTCYCISATDKHPHEKDKKVNIADSIRNFAPMPLGSGGPAKLWSPFNTFGKNRTALDELKATFDMKLVDEGKRVAKSIGSGEYPEYTEEEMSKHFMMPLFQTSKDEDANKDEDPSKDEEASKDEDDSGAFASSSTG